MTPFSEEYRPLRLRKLHSLTGVFPVGIFLILHLWTNAQAMQGRPAFDARVSAVQRLPLLPAIEVVAVLVPLSFHALYGIKLSFGGPPNVTRRHPYDERSWSYALQRTSGFVALAFIAYHFCQFRLKLYLGDMAPSDLFPELCAVLSGTTKHGIPAAALAYLFGTAAIVYHFTYGLYAFCFTWDVAVSWRESRPARFAFAAMGVGLYLVAANTVFFLATGVGLVPW